MEQAGDRSVSGRGAPEKGSCSAFQEDSEWRRGCAGSWGPWHEGQPGCSALGSVPGARSGPVSELLCGFSEFMPVNLAQSLRGQSTQHCVWCPPPAAAIAPSGPVS